MEERSQTARLKHGHPLGLGLQPRHLAKVRNLLNGPESFVESKSICILSHGPPFYLHTNRPLRYIAQLMATPSISIRLARTWRALNGSSLCHSCARSRRLASTQATATIPDSIFDLVESTSLDRASVASPDSYDPVSKSKERKWQLPPSRYTSPSGRLQLSVS